MLTIRKGIMIPFDGGWLFRDTWGRTWKVEITQDKYLPFRVILWEEENESEEKAITEDPSSSSNSNSI